jgi:hypothetical protein
VLQLGDEHHLVLELAQPLRRVLGQPLHRHRLPSFQLPLNTIRSFASVIMFSSTNFRKHVT